MPVLLDGSHPPVVRVQVGDVLMVAKKLKDKVTKKPYWWRFFAIVVEHKRYRADVIRIGGEEGKDEFSITLRSDEEQGFMVHYLPPEEWPDGVHAFRMRLILEGRLEDIV